MILEEDIAEIGQLFKPHGVKGEISASFDDPDLDPTSFRCLILKMDGLPVPFFIESARRRGEGSWLLKFDALDSEADVLRIARHDVYALRNELPEQETEAEEGIYLYDLIGYEVLDAEEKPVGTVSDVDDSTFNTLLIVDLDGDADRKVMLPLADELVLWLDTESHRIALQFPPEILDLNS